MRNEVKNTENSFNYGDKIEDTGKEEMAKKKKSTTKKKKMTYVRGHYREVNGERIRIKPHYRNVPDPDKKKARERKRR